MEKQESEQQREQNPNQKNKMTEEKPKQEEKASERPGEVVRKEEIIRKDSNADIEKTPQKNEVLSTNEKSKPSDETNKNISKDSEVNDKKQEKDKSTSKEESKEKKSVETKPKVKKTEAVVNITSLPISRKHSTFVCKFIKGKKIEDAIKDLEKVILLKKPVPMKGEIPHRKGMMSGRYPKKTAEHFIKLLKGLSANANVNGLENPIISEAIANLASRPYSKFGRVRRKRTHVKIVVKEKIVKEVKK